MSHLDIILPFSIPPAPLARDLLREIKAPAFAELIGHARLASNRQFDAFSRILPHEAAIYQTDFLSRSGNPHSSDLATKVSERGSSPASTHLRMRQFGITPAPGYWFTLCPVHIHIARDHLVLTDQHRLALSEAEAQILFQSAAKICQELGFELIYGNPKTWFLRADQWQDLNTASLDAACGHNIEIWMPQGTHERAWRRLQNEIQMEWHCLPLNQSREERAENPVNSVWLYGGSTELDKQPNFSLNRLSFDAIFNTCVFDVLTEAALNNDWASWLDGMHNIETNCMQALVDGLRQKTISSVRILASDARQIQEFHINTRSRLKFWRKASLTSLFELNKMPIEENH